MQSEGVNYDAQHGFYYLSADQSDDTQHYCKYETQAYEVNTISVYKGTRMLEYADNMVYAVGITGTESNPLPIFIKWDFPKDSGDDIMKPRWVYSMTDTMQADVNLDFSPKAMKWDPHSDRIIVAFTVTSMAGDETLICNLDADGSIVRCIMTNMNELVRNKYSYGTSAASIVAMSFSTSTTN